MIIGDINIVDTTLKDNSKPGLKLMDVKWSVKTAGPSPFNNERTELFLLGCEKALAGHPCKGCFNSSTWDASKVSLLHDPIKMAEHINNTSPNKYITVGGGEPTDQIEGLIVLCKELKEKYNFHIMVYTWRCLEFFLSRKYVSFEIEQGKHFNRQLRELLKYVDIIVDGEFKIEEKLWDGTKEDGLISSVGSGNQIVWDIQKGYGYAMRDINKLTIVRDTELQYDLKDNANKILLNSEGEI